MQTLYYTTTQWVSRESKIIDFAAYRDRIRAEEHAEEETEGLHIAPPRAPRRSESGRRERALLLDICASVSVIVMTLTLTLHVIA